MKLTNQRKGVAIVLGLGVLALGLDRFVLRADQAGPETAEASPTDSTTPSTSDAPPIAASMPSAAAGPSLSDRLEKHRTAGADAADAFALPAEWIVPIAKEKPVVAAPEVKDPLHQLANQLKLTAIIPGRNGAQSSAVINGKTLRAGVAETVQIGADKYSLELVSTDDSGSAVIRFTSSKREVTIKGQHDLGSENSRRSSR